MSGCLVDAQGPLVQGQRLPGPAVPPEVDACGAEQPCGCAGLRGAGVVAGCGQDAGQQRLPLRPAIRVSPGIAGQVSAQQREYCLQRIAGGCGWRWRVTSWISRWTIRLPPLRRARE
jgi:hypothetical protein